MAIKKEISVEVIEKAKKALANIPVKAATSKLVDEALEDLKPTILDLETKGYTRPEIIELLGKQGVHVKPYAIKRVMASKRADKAE